MTEEELAKRLYYSLRAVYAHGSDKQGIDYVKMLLKAFKLKVVNDD